MPRRSVVIIVLVTAVLAMSVPVVEAADSQSWYFTNTDASIPIYSGADYNKTMTKGVEGGDNTVTLAPGECVWFYADEVAQCYVGFPEEKWSVVYWVKASHSGEAGEGRVYTRLGYVDSTGSPTRLGSTSASEAITSPQTIEEIVEDWFSNNNVESFTVPDGGRLAVEVLWGSNPLGNLEIHCNPTDNHASNMTSPTSDPGYPIPELPILVLFSFGLLTLAGYVTYSRKKKRDDKG
jgi:hypothetical protein